MTDVESAFRLEAITASVLIQERGTEEENGEEKEEEDEDEEDERIAGTERIGGGRKLEKDFKRMD